MPTGDQTEAKLFYAIGDGEWNEISCIRSIEMDNFCGTAEQDDFKPFSIEPHSFSFELELNKKGSSLFVKFLRLTKPNNWLKMHGYHMRRRFKKR